MTLTGNRTNTDSLSKERSDFLRPYAGRKVQGKNIFVGLSGGVDSAVSAALLQRDGARVTGVFIKGWYPPGMPCTWASDRRDAMRVAARLHIPFYTLDASTAYKESVIDYLLEEYRAGRTPNPDIMCNKEVKFGVFYRFAKEAGADAIATGHYIHGEKDQRYFLWAVPKSILQETYFPVGYQKKNEVRTLARHFQLPVAEKRDSQGVCFLGAVSVEEFLKSEFGESPGVARDETSQVIGTHNGVLLHTLGERISLAESSLPGPWFVLAKEVQKNELIVGKTRIPTIQKQYEIPYIDANWFGEPSQTTEAQYRYRGPRVPGKVSDATFLSTEPLSEIPTPGQSIVFYQGDEVTGGGIITI
ncbi:MAG TPA: tRNA 2-thiouridine(34) synthase MnmA [Candidatus Paceibacterota bacterium]|nr:tRNA 2-thiouridine(34) synthase MnmA [Candidatus Paceibacterota bacterium]